MPTSDSSVEFIPPAPSPRYVPPTARPTPMGYVRYFQIMARNPLEIWTEGHFNQLVHKDRIFGRDYALVHDPEYIRQFLVTNAANYGLTFIRKAIFEPVTGQGLFVIEGEKWKRTRHALTPVFTPRHVQGFALIMKLGARRKAAEFQKRVGDVIDISEEMIALTLEILMSCLFSDDTEMDVERFSKNLDRLFAVAGMPHPFDLISAPTWVPRFGRGEVGRLVADLRQQVATVANARREMIMEGREAPADFLTLLLRAGVEEGAPLSDDEIIDNLLTFLGAGHETTARTLAWTIYLLSKSDGALSQMQNEIEGADLDAVPPEKWSDILPYTAAVIKESMRLYPSAPVVSRMSLGADKLGDIAIDPSTEMVVSTWVLHRHRKLWREPDLFDPGRFLGNEAEKLPRYAYMPFGAGPRVCIGASFAMQEMVIVLATLFSQLRFSHEGAEPEPIMRITIQPSTNIEMKIDRCGAH